MSKPAAVYLFTFGSNHAHAKKYVKFFGSHQSARDEMIKRFGDAWSFQYPLGNEPILVKKGYTELVIDGLHRVGFARDYLLG